MTSIFVPNYVYAGSACSVEMPGSFHPCTRPLGHGGRHHAAGMPRREGLPIFAVWGDA